MTLLTTYEVEAILAAVGPQGPPGFVDPDLMAAIDADPASVFRVQQDARQAAAYAPQARTVGAGTGLSGGGDLSADRSLAVVFATPTEVLAGKAVPSNDPRLSDARTPTAHGHALADLPVAASGVSDATKLTRSDDSRLANSRTPTAHAHLLADLPVAASGVSDATKVTRSDDSRLADSRTPTAHQHGAADVTSGAFALARLPVADNEEFNATEIVRADDSRLRRALAQGPSGGEYVRLAVVDGAHATQGNAVTLLIAGTGSIGSRFRSTTLVHFGQRGDNVIELEGWRFGTGITTPWTFYSKQITTNVYELWAFRSSFDSVVGVTMLSRGGITTALYCDSNTPTDPGGLVALPSPLIVGGSTIEPGKTVLVTAAANVTSSGTGLKTFAGGYVININVTLTAALAAAATLFTIPAGYRPTFTFFGAAPEASAGTLRLLEVQSSGAVTTNAALASGVTLRGQIVVAGPLQ